MIGSCFKSISVSENIAEEITGYQNAHEIFFFLPQRAFTASVSIHSITGGYNHG